MSATTVPVEALREAYAHARDARYPQAEQLCRALLAKYSDSAELWLLLGIVQVQTRQAADAVASIRQSLSHGESRAATYALLGDALSLNGALTDALVQYDRALKMDSRLVSAQMGKGSALIDLEQAQAALACFDQVLVVAAGDAEAWCKRGIAQLKLGQPALALASLDQAIKLRPEFALAHATRGAAHMKLLHAEDALSDFDAALASNPHFLEAACNRGESLRSLSRLEEAHRAFMAVLQLQPNHRAALRARAEVLREMGRPRTALAGFAWALRVNPEDADALRGQGDVYLDLGRACDALTLHEKASRLKPNCSDIENSRGNSLFALERFGEAIAAYRRSLELNADNAAAHYNLGTAWFRLGSNPHDVIAHFARALELRPKFPNLPGALLYAQRCVADWLIRVDSAAPEAIVKGALNGECVAAPFHLLAITDDARAQRRCAEAYLSHRLPPSPSPGSGQVGSGSRLRVAYLSSDFREHAITRLMAGVFEHHDRRCVEVVGVYLAPGDGSPLSRRVEAAFDERIDVSALGDEEAATLLQRERIDVAVDLNGLTDGARPGLLKRRIAPVQVTYLGLPATTGAAFIDYVLADEFVIPLEQREHFREQVVYLPGCFQANDEASFHESRTTDRAEVGLPASAFVFCCFNHTSKITPAMFDAWMNILKQVSNSVLWLLADEPLARDNLRREVSRRGIETQRVIFAGRVSRSQFRAQLKLADLFLDTFPFNAGATASEVLAAGLPLLSVAGRSFASRMAGSLLHAIGMQRLACADLREYEHRAIELARSAAELPALRRELNEGGAISGLFDTRALTGALEQAFRRMADIYASGANPSSFKVG